MPAFRKLETSHTGTSTAIFHKYDCPQLLLYLMHGLATGPRIMHGTMRNAHLSSSLYFAQHAWCQDTLLPADKFNKQMRWQKAGPRKQQSSGTSTSCTPLTAAAERCQGPLHRAAAHMPGYQYGACCGTIFSFHQPQALLEAQPCNCIAVAI